MPPPASGAGCNGLRPRRRRPRAPPGLRRSHSAPCAPGSSASTDSCPCAASAPGSSARPIPRPLGRR
eukprot:4635046-Heterocapsa_arctica.AAC.1